MPFAIIRDDITKMRVGAIVNAANPSLLGGGGVDGAIHRAAGPRLLKECARLGGCEIGEAKITMGYDLPCKYVIHTVGPIWSGGSMGEERLPASCYRNSLELARKRGCESVAFPLISSGVYGYPKELALNVAVEAIGAFLKDNEMRVYLALFDKAACKIGGRLFDDVAQYIDDVYVDAHTDSERESLRRVADRDLPTALMPSMSKAAYAADELSVNAARPFSGVESLFDSLDEGFAQALFRKIDERGMTDVECYKRANIDRKLFSKIKGNPEYKPSKPTVLAFAIALRLSLEETRELLMKAGFALSRSSKFDVILEYCIRNGVFDVNEVNGVLFRFDQSLLGSF